MLAPGLAAVRTHQHAIAGVGEGAVERGLILFGIRTDVMLEGHEDAAVSRGDRWADEGALLEAAGQFARLAPGLERVVARQIPGAPVVGPVFRVGREEQRRSAVADEDFGRALADGLPFAREADVEGRQWRPGLSFVGAAGDAGVVQRGRFGVAAGEHEQDPRLVGQQAQGRVAHHPVWREPVVRHALAILLGVLDTLGGPLGAGFDRPSAELGVRGLQRFVDEATGDLGLLGDVFFGELGQQDLGVGVSVPIVEDVDLTIRGLEAVGIGDRGAVVEQ